MSLPTAHVRYAFNPRQGAMSNGAEHAVLDQPLHAGQLHRKAGDALCKPRGRFWGLEPCRAERVTCTRCLALAERHAVTVQAAEPSLPF